MGLWSQVDVQAGHRLRYEKASLVTLLDSMPDCDTVEIVPFNRHLVPAMLVQRRLVVKNDLASRAEANFRLPPTLINRVFLLLAYLEMLMAPILDRTRIGGASLWFAVQRLSSGSASMCIEPGQ
jgi:hypothetical protein